MFRQVFRFRSPKLSKMDPVLTIETPQNQLLEVCNVGKRFPGVLALNNVTWNLHRGEVHALVGENGAGKSSLVKVLSGVYQPDEGHMTLNGEPYAPTAPHMSLASGLRVVYQEFTLLPDLSVAENLTLENPPSRFGFVNRRAQRDSARRLLAAVGLKVAMSAIVGQLGIAQKQLLEIAKALAGDSQILVLDEPTATLTGAEVGELFRVIRDLRSSGVAIVYISHHLDEIFEIADRVTVMRNGTVAATNLVSDVSVSDLVRLMVGREVSLGEIVPPEVKPDAPQILRVENLRVRGSAHPISFAVRAGEVVGVAGLVGSGRTEALRAIFGADGRDSGEVWLNGKQIDVRSPRDAVNAGLCLLTEDRKGQGLMLGMSGTANTTIANLQMVSRRHLLNRNAEQTAAEQFRRSLNIRTPSVSTLVGNLSGGNQQKYVLAKWLFRDASALMVDEPTRGIDIGAKFEVYEILHQLAAQGRALIVVSSDLPELLLLCHRILVFSKGRIAGTVERKDFSAEAILNLAFHAHTDLLSDSASPSPITPPNSRN
jgi:ribose transport system ATP-binding protein